MPINPLRGLGKATSIGQPSGPYQPSGIPRISAQPKSRLEELTGLDMGPFSKYQEFMDTLYENPAIQALGFMPQGGASQAVGFMTSTNRVANASKFIESIAKQANRLKNPSSIYDAAIKLLQDYPHTLGHLKKLTFPKELKNMFGDTLEASGMFSKHSSPRSWPPSVKKLNRRRLTQTPKYAITFETGKELNPRDAAIAVRHEAAHAGQAVSGKDWISPNDVGYWLDPREIRARAVASKAEFTGKPMPYIDRLRDSIAEGVQNSNNGTANRFFTDWKADNLKFPNFQKTPTESVPFREWMNSRYPGFDKDLEQFVTRKPWERN